MSKKYRPSLTLQDINIILLGLSQVQGPSVQAVQAKFKILLTKVDLGVANPAYTTDPKPSILDRLGKDHIDNQEVLTPQQKREAAYIKYKGTPDQCTQYEIDMAKTYMYENNMYTPEERLNYENEFFGDV